MPPPESAGGKGHRKPKAGRKAEKRKTADQKKKGVHEEAQASKGAGKNPRAFSFQSAIKAKAQRSRSAEKEQRRLHGRRCQGSQRNETTTLNGRISGHMLIMVRLDFSPPPSYSSHDGEGGRGASSHGGARAWATWGESYPQRMLGYHPWLRLGTACLMEHVELCMHACIKLFIVHASFMPDVIPTHPLL